MSSPCLVLFGVVLSLTIPFQAQVSSSPNFSGTWTATVGESKTLRGRWIGAPIPGDPTAAHGSWTMSNAAGKAVMSGTWSARKTLKGWTGTWSAQTESGRAAAGTWKADLAADPKATIQDFLERVASEEISGTWRSGRSAGSWWLTGKQARPMR